MKSCLVLKMWPRAGVSAALSCSSLWAVSDWLILAKGNAFSTRQGV